MAPFENDRGPAREIEAVNTALEAAHEALNRVVPADPKQTECSSDSSTSASRTILDANVDLAPQNVSHSELILIAKGTRR